MLRQHEHKLLSTRTNTNNNRRKQEQSQTNTDSEDRIRRQGHHDSLEPITVGPWCIQYYVICSKTAGNYFSYQSCPF